MMPAWLSLIIKGHPMKRVFFLSAVIVLFHAPVWGQAVSGVRGVNGGGGALNNLPRSPSRLYIDGQGTQGFLSKPAGAGGAFQSYLFKTPNGATWIGSVTPLGPHIKPGFGSGENPSLLSLSSATFILSPPPPLTPPPPPELPPLPQIGSPLLEDIP